MAVETRQEVLDECFIIPEQYKDIVHSKFNESIFLSDVDTDYIKKSSKIINQICAKPVMEPSSLGVLTVPITDLEAIKERIDATDKLLTFPDLKSIESDHEEVFDKVKWAEDNNFIYVDNKNALVNELFNFRVDSSNYCLLYYVEKYLYSPNETPAISVFRDCPDLDIYKTLVRELQENSFRYSGKSLKLSDEFNEYIIKRIKEEGQDINYESLITDSMDLLKTCNDSFDINMFDCFFVPESDYDDGRRRR